MPSKQSTSKAPAMSFPGTVKRALSSADVSSAPVSVNPETGSFTVVMITGTPVRRLIDDPRNPGQKVLVDEVIVPEGVDLCRARGMPLIDGHKTDAGISAILGKIDNVRLEDGKIIGDTMFASDHEHLLKDVQRGFYRQGSICADILEVEWIERPDDKGRQAVSEPDAVSTYTWDDFISSFPQPGTSIGSGTGWTLAEAKIEGVVDNIPDWLTISGAKFGSASGGQVQLLSKTVQFRLTAAYDYTQQREEILDISLPNGLQEFPEEDDEKETPETITLGALNVDSSTPEWLYEDPDTFEIMHYVVGDEVLAAGKAWTCVFEHDATDEFRIRDYDDDPVLWERREKRAPMRDARSSRFLDSNRGIRAVRHGILRLHRVVLERSQCAEVTFDVPWQVGRSITCNDSARIAHRRLPGGEMTGKVISVDLIIAKRGRRSAKITLAAVPGNGSIAPEPGPEQQQTGDIVYSTSYRGVREPVNAFALASQPPRVYFYENDWSVQHAAAVASGDPVGTIGTRPTRLRLAFTPLREEDLLTRRMSVTCLPPSLPKQINLRPILEPEMSQKLIMGLSGFVQKRIRSEVDGRPRTVTVDVMARWDVDNESGLVIGSEQPIDASSCQINTRVTFVAPA